MCTYRLIFIYAPHNIPECFCRNLIWGCNVYLLHIFNISILIYVVTVEYKSVEGGKYITCGCRECAGILQSLWMGWLWFAWLLCILVFWINFCNNIDNLNIYTQSVNFSRKIEESKNGDNIQKEECEQNLSLWSCINIKRTSGGIRFLNICKNLMDFSKVKE